ncbi:hypothetical protein [Sinomonas humi]|uniref:hypothetical protein n=1 Tax=Sinomonas humi TaxID=1338436 RepID=UPI0012E02505|nr:hypothetical protein [Sinomonas humi]
MSEFPGAGGGAGGVWDAPGTAGCIPGTGLLGGAECVTDGGARGTAATADGVGWPESAELA